MTDRLENALRATHPQANDAEIAHLAESYRARAWTTPAYVRREIEIQEAEERRDHKRDLRRRLPAPARQLVTMADDLDALADAIHPRTRYQTWTAPDQLHAFASDLRRALEDLAEKE